MDSSVLFVFYTLNKSSYWRYDGLPNGWRWTGCGSTSAVNAPKKIYESQEQFNGPEETKQEVKNYLTEYFNELYENDIIKRFKIRNSYIPDH